MDSRRRRLRAARSRRRSRRTGRVIVGSGHPGRTRQSAHWIRAKTAPTLESCTYTLVLVQKYAHEINIKATLRPLQKIYNYLCGPALEFPLKKKLKDQRNYAKCACAAFHHCKGNACVLFQQSSWFYSDWFLTFRLSLTIPLSFGRHKFLHWCIEIFRQHNHFNHSLWSNVGSPFNSYPFRCDLVSPPIQFFIEFLCSFSFWQFDWV